MRKSDLVNTISSTTGINKVDVLLVLETAFREIKGSTAQNEPIFIRGFGTFTTKKRAAKKARIVKKNIEILLQAKKIPYFKPSKEFLKLVEQKSKEKGEGS